MAKKLFYKIGEACRMLDIQPYVLRYWETEFSMLSPDKSRSGQRVYSGEDLRVIRRIKELLYDEGYTIAGAKKKLEQELAQTGAEAEGNGEVAEDAVEPRDGKGVEGEVEAAAGELDTSAEDRIESLRQGVERLLSEARELLDLLR